MSLFKNSIYVYTIKGERQEFHIKKVKMADWVELRQLTGLTSSDVIDGALNGDAVSKAAIVWLTRRQKDRIVRWKDVTADIDREDMEFTTLGVIVDGVVELGEPDEVLPADPPTVTP